MKKLNYFTIDSWDRQVFTDGKEYFVMVDGVLHDMTDQGEPFCPVNFKWELEA